MSRKHQREPAPEWAASHYEDGLPKTKSSHPLYATYFSMMARCYGNPTRVNLPYQKKGIQVCEAWKKDFWAFVKDVWPKPSPEHSMDRIDNDGNYEPSNVRWATRHEQQLNRKVTVRASYGGKDAPLMELAEQHGINYGTVVNRIRLGWDTEKALKTPPEARIRPEDDRRTVVRKMYESGSTLEEIGEHFGFTKERARQLLYGKKTSDQKTCRNCGKMIPAYTARAYCNFSCRDEFNGIRPRECRGCGTELTVKGKQYCSDACRPNSYDAVRRRMLLSELRKLPIEQLEGIVRGLGAITAA